MGGFRTTENTGSIFFGAKSGGFYANGAASIANLDVTRVAPRSSGWVSPRESPKPSPSGSNASANVNAGYDFALGKFSVGPTAGWTTQNVEVNGFDETGAGSANLRIATQKRRSEVVSVGIRASFDLGAVTPYAKFTADKERNDDERLITAAPLSLTAVNAYDLPAYQPADSSWSTFTVGVRGMMTSSIAYGLNYSKVSGRSGVTEDYVSGTVSVRF